MCANKANCTYTNDGYNFVGDNVFPLVREFINNLKASDVTGLIPEWRELCGERKMTSLQNLEKDTLSTIVSWCVANKSVVGHDNTVVGNNMTINDCLEKEFLYMAKDGTVSLPLIFASISE